MHGLTFVCEKYDVIIILSLWWSITVAKIQLLEGHNVMKAIVYNK